MKSLIAFFTIFLLLTNCTSEKRNLISEQTITDIGIQDSLFRSLSAITSPTLPNDSIAFLVLPLEASCPSCREKTIDSIIRYKDNLGSNRFIILSVNGGRKIINSYFLDQDDELPNIPGQLFLDSTSQSSDHDLFEANPVFYYVYNKRVYKKVSAEPSTIKKDLQEFFSGNSNKN